MPTVTFDTHKFIKRLEAAVEAARDVISESQIATRGDLDALRKDIDVRFAQIDSKFAEVKGEMLLLKWMMGILIAGVASLVLKAFF